MAKSLLALGSNLDDPQKNLRKATGELGRLPQTRVISRSSWFATNPVGGPSGQGAFLNSALLIETSLSPHDLQRAVHQVEAKLGRERKVRWDARIIDIDILLYDQTELHTDDLVLPHPRMSFRRFVLAPAQEIAGGMIHPPSSRTIGQLLRHLQATPASVVVCGGNGESVTSENQTPLTDLADKLSDSVEKRFSLSHRPKIASMSEQLPKVSSAVPTLVISWDGTTSGKHDNEGALRKNIQWKGPLAIVTGQTNAEVAAEAIAAVEAAFSD